MRLNEKYIKVIKKYFFEIFNHGEIYLFGSRADDSKKGGDIDLYLVVEDKRNIFRKKIKYLAKTKRELGEQKIDIIFNMDKERLVEKEARQWGIKL